MISINLTKSEKNKENIVKYKCPKRHLTLKLFLSFYIYRSSLNNKLLKNKEAQFGRYYRCPECNTSYYEDEWEVIDLDFNQI